LRLESGAVLALTDFTLEAQQLLRDETQFKWYVVTLLVLVLYVYAVEVERRRWDVILAGLAFWLADWINEIANSLVLHFTDRAAIWTTTGDTAYLILIGLTIEISLMFAISGVVFAKTLPVFGYLWFFLIAAYVYDLPDNRRRLWVVGPMATLVAGALLVFGPLLEWI
jgi:hypothetical protein